MRMRDETLVCTFTPLVRAFEQESSITTRSLSFKFHKDRSFRRYFQNNTDILKSLNFNVFWQIFTDYFTPCIMCDFVRHQAVAFENKSGSNIT